jgi:hypothetical protein
MFIWRWNFRTRKKVTLIIRVSGGLGNQIFQYALYNALIEKGFRVKMDLEAYSNRKKYSVEYELKKVFGLIPKTCNRFERNKLIGSLILRKLNQKLFTTKFLQWKKSNYYFEKNSYLYDPAIFRLKEHKFLVGYWQSEKYFIDIATKIKKEFSFLPPNDPKNQLCINKINNSNSISIHIRRGDYLNIPKYLEIGTINFYRRAINYVEQIIENPLYLFFSDDINWVMANLTVKGNYILVNWNNGENNYRDMHLMSLCKHNIITISSFSWWAAWLNSNPAKIIIAPKEISINIGSDYLSENWIQI